MASLVASLASMAVSCDKGHSRGLKEKKAEGYWFRSSKYRSRDIPEGPDTAGFRKHHLVAFCAHTSKPIGFEDLDEFLVGDGAKLWHV